MKDGSCLTREELEEAERLVKAACSDLRAVVALASDDEQDNDVVGFHRTESVRQQAIV
jgi:hypothetical protein